jgi:hypothetical protein
MSAPGARGFSRGAQGVQVNPLNPRPVSPCAAEGGPPTPQVRLCRNKADGEAPGVGGGPDVKLSLGKLGEGDYFGAALRGRSPS